MEAKPHDPQPGSPVRPPIEGARKIFRTEVKPAITISSAAHEFLRVMQEYKNALNASVVDGNLNGEVLTTAQFVVGAKEDREKEEVLYNWFVKFQGGTESLLSSYFKGDEVKQTQLKQQIGENLAHWVTIRKGLGLAFRKQLEQKQLEKMATYLLDNALHFHGLRHSISAVDTDPLEQVKKVGISSHIEGVILQQQADVAAFGMRDWVAETSRAARQKGRKIYETPYYSNKLEELRFLGKKKNGVGGVILYGPPGTGKTELAQKKNADQGFRTRVINIHHYTSFEDLIAGKAIQLGLDRGAGIASQVKTVLDVVEGQKPLGFAKDLEALVDQLKSEGKLADSETANSFLLSFVSENSRTLLGKKELTEDEWKIVKDDYAKTQRARLLRTTLPKTYQEVLEDIVKGEILLAMQNGERVVLDEIDKAGPNSLGGILSFLAKSPGDPMLYGQSKITIPSWFTVDCTSNSTQLDDYLKDRFTPMEIDTPPVKDQLMIAAVRLSDDQGNILLTPFEQRQLIGFFVYAAPAVNALLKETGFPPLSNRAIQRLTSSLVDFGNMERTSVSVGDAIRTLLSKHMLLPDEVMGSINEVLNHFGPNVLADKPYDFQQQTAAADTSKEAQLAKSIADVISTPMFTSIYGLGENMQRNSQFQPYPVELTQKQLAEIKKILNSQHVDPRGDTRLLQTGMVLRKVRDGGIEVVVAVPQDEVIQRIYKAIMKSDGKIVGASSDGLVLALESENTENNRLSTITVYQVTPDGKFEYSQVHSFRVHTGAKLAMDGSGTYMATVDGSTHIAYFAKAGSERVHEIPSVSELTISPDGKYCIIQKLTGETSLYSTDTLQPVLHMSGKTWKFIGNDILISEQNGTVSQHAFLIAS